VKNKRFTTSLLLALLLKISSSNYYFSFYDIGDAIEARKGCGIAQCGLCRGLSITTRGIHDADKAVPDPGCGGAWINFMRVAVDSQCWRGYGRR
jgi:hypothetical protein